MNDLKFAFRQLLKNPGFTAVAVLTLALGIGANTAIFSVVNALVIQRLPYRDPEQIVQVFSQNEKTKSRSVWISPPDFVDLATQSEAFQEIAGWREWELVDRQDGEPISVMGAALSTNLFAVLGAQPYLGRMFFSEEAQANDKRAVILTHAFWQRRFGADPKIIGKAVQFGDQTFMPVGVTAPDFNFPTEPASQWKPELFVPLWFRPVGEDRSSSSVHVLARLKPGVTLERAQAEAGIVSARLAKQYPQTNTDRGMRLVPLHESLVGQVRPALLMLFASVSFVLLIACANVANLLLARAVSRRREIAVRCVLGASRFRLLRQFLTESLLLCGLGGTGGLLVAAWVLNLLIAILPENFPRIVQLQIDPWVLGFTAGTALLAGLVLGTVPAFQRGDTDLSRSLKGASGLFGSPAGHGYRNLLAIAEVALALVLSVGAGLLVKSYWRVTHIDLGFSPENVQAVGVWASASNAAQRDAFYLELFERVRRLPGVESVAGVDFLPLLRGDSRSSFTILGHPLPASPNDQMAHVRGITADYFRALKIPVIKGRPFSEKDTAQSEKVVILNQALVRLYFGEQDPVGQLLDLNGQRKVVGVVGDVKPNGFESLVAPEIFVPFKQRDESSMQLLVRTSEHSRGVAANLRAEILALNPDVPVDSIRALEQILAWQVAPRRFNAILLGCFAALGLMIAIVGVYGVISYSISERTREIGVRMALGAQRSDVLSLVVGQGMRLALLGVGIGLAAALALSRMLQTLLFEIKPADPFTFAIIPLALAGVALFACWVPAQRAARVDPMEALRYE